MQSSSLPSSPQRPLDIALRQYATFDTFVCQEGNGLPRLLKGLSQALREPRQYFLWGHHHSGKSHLLQATCNYLSQSDQKAVYLPMKEFSKSDPDLLNDLQQLDVICMDDIHCVLGDRRWERALFRLVNESWLGNKSLVVTALGKPGDLDILLPDLASRLGWGLVYRLHPLSDEQKETAIRLHARARGLDVPPEVCGYLLKRYPRGLAELVRLLDKLDQHSLALQRRITVPFVKSVLEKVGA